MEGISIGEDGGGWYVSLNLEVRSHTDVTGYPTLEYFEVDNSMTLLDGETRLSPKLLIKW